MLHARPPHRAMPPKKRQSKSGAASRQKQQKTAQQPSRKRAKLDKDAEAAKAAEEDKEKKEEEQAAATPSKKSPSKKATAAAPDKVEAGGSGGAAAGPDPEALPNASSTAKDASGRPWLRKLASWNINGLRAWLKANGTRYVTQEAPFVIGVQEIKCPAAKVPQEAQIPGYHAVFSSADKDGYAGTGIYCREKPLSVREGIGKAKHDAEGRVIAAEFADFYFVTAYVPNSGRELARLKYRVSEWDRDFAEYLRGLDAVKPVILCGDLNVAHGELDLANPKTNQRTAGFTKEERNSFSAMLTELGLVDTFRAVHPDRTGAYTFWSYMRNARAKNVGWRLDYFLVSKRLADRVCDSVIRSQVMGSDHCPIVLLLSI